MKNHSLSIEKRYRLYIKAANIFQNKETLAGKYISFQVKSLYIHYFIYLSPYTANVSNSSSIWNNWLYFAIRAERDLTNRFFICPPFVVTEILAIVVSYVSPERCEVTAVRPWRCATTMTSDVSISEPVWLILIRIGLAHSKRMPSYKKSTFVKHKSSPTIKTERPDLFFKISGRCITNINIFLLKKNIFPACFRSWFSLLQSMLGDVNRPDIAQVLPSL